MDTVAKFTLPILISSSMDDQKGDPGNEVSKLTSFATIVLQLTHYFIRRGEGSDKTAKN